MGEEDDKKCPDCGEESCRECSECKKCESCKCE